MNIVLCIGNSLGKNTCFIRLFVSINNSEYFIIYKENLIERFHSVVTFFINSEVIRIEIFIFTETTGRNHFKCSLSLSIVKQNVESNLFSIFSQNELVNISFSHHEVSDYLES